MSMNPDYEFDRYTFVIRRDGKAAADAFARQSIRVYLARCKEGRLKRGKRFQYRVKFLEGAYSFRAMLRLRWVYQS